MSTDATAGTMASTRTAVRNQSFVCRNCRISTNATATSRCPGCHGRYPSNPNPTYPSISIYGPFAPSSTQTPLHTSDYIDSDDEDLFDSILDRIASQGQDQGLSPTSKSFIDSLPVVKVTFPLCKSCSRTCSICKDEFECDETVNQLPCKHEFHRDCIVPWLNRSNSCPLCRYKLPAERRPKPLMMYVVRLGNLYVEGWGEDHESGFRDAVQRNGLFTVLSRQSSSSSSSSWTRSMRIGRAQRGSVGPAGSEDTVSSQSVESYVDGATSGLANGVATVMLDEDGDTVMLDA